MKLIGNLLLDYYLKENILKNSSSLLANFEGSVIAVAL